MRFLPGKQTICLPLIVGIVTNGADSGIVNNLRKLTKVVVSEAMFGGGSSTLNFGIGCSNV